MCKLLTILDIENQTKAEKFLKASLPFMTKNDKDGLGLMRLGANGVFINRWVTAPKVLDRPLPSASPYRLAIEADSNEEGTPSPYYLALCLHSRQATSAVSINNTHPFYTKGSALAHNGVVHGDALADNVLSSCDSEMLLWRYIKGEVLENPENLTSALDGIGGYYACTVFNDNGIVDIWRDGIATLYLAHVQGVGTVICTSGEIISKTCKALRLRVLSLAPVLPFSHIRWERDKSPKVLTFEKIAPPTNTAIKTYDRKKEFDKNSSNWWNDPDDAMNKIIKLKSAPDCDDAIAEHTINALAGRDGI